MNAKYEYKRIEEQQIAFIRKPLIKRDELKERFDTLQRVCKEQISGSALIIYHFDTGVTEGLDVEAAYPVTGTIDSEEVSNRILERVEAMSTVHRGPYGELSNVWNTLRNFSNSKALAHGLSPREVYLEGPFCENPDDNVTELQATVHDWDKRFHSSLGEVLGSKVRDEILQGYDELTPFTNAEERADWTINAIKKLDAKATEDEKYQIISKCAHIRPKEEIEQLKAVYEKNHDVDEFLEYYANSLPFIEKPYREGSIIYQSKPPADPEAYRAAKSQHELIQAACFCPIIKASLDRMPRSFCYCGAGWARQMFESVFGQPLKIEILETVIDGGRLCKYAIHLPEGILK
ncbi:MAG: GyrI-like domain-containing protein [Candidatus Thorarchaeota archaeon]|nr:GyrI-like domain-containing protein [Candidatus Thorarchaeota archaeon]